MSPLIPADRFSAALTFSLPESQERSAPASRTRPACFNWKISPQHTGEVFGSLATGARGDVFLDALLDLAIEIARVFVRSPGNERVFDSGDPAVDDVSQGAARAGGGAQLLDDFALDVVEFVEVEVVVGHDDEAGGKSFLLRIVQSEPRHEGLAAAVAATQEFERSSRIVLATAFNAGQSTAADITAPSSRTSKDNPASRSAAIKQA
jgi:hypothetical protein